MNKKSSGILIILLLTLLLFHRTAFGEEKRYGGTLRLASITEPASLNPVIARDSVSTHLGALLFNSLVRLNGRGEVVGELADSWNVSDDGLTWSFKLKKGVRFHDGSELTSDDVLFTFERIKEVSRNTPFSSLFDIVRSFDAPERYLFRLHLKRPYSPVIYLMMKEIVPRHLLEGKEMKDPSFGRNPVGTGPFVMSRWDKRGILLKANPDYFKGRPYLDSIQVRFFPTRLAAWVSLLKGKIDLVTDLNYEDYRVVRKDERFRVYDYLSNFYYTLLFNTRDPLFSNPTLRRAISLAIDRDDLISTVLEGNGVVTTGPFLPGSWAYNENVDYQGYDPERASRLLRREGYRDTDGDMIVEKDGRELRLEILLDRGDEIKERLAKRIKWQLLKAGIRVDIRVIERRTLFGKMLFPGRFQSVLLQFNTGAYPDKNTYLFWHSANIGKSNIARYKNRNVDSLIEEAWETRDLSEKEFIYKRIHRIISEDAPAAFLFYRRKFLAVSSRIGGVKPEPQVIYHSISGWYEKK